MNSCRVRVWWFALCALVVGCQVEGNIPDGAKISCARDAECPEGFRCAAGLCVAVGANQRPRVIVGTPARSVDVVSIPITVIDFEGDTTSLTATFGDPAQAATTDPLSVKASEQGVTAVLTWRAALDLPSIAYVPDMVVHVTPSGGEVSASPPFEFGNDAPVVVPDALGGTKSGDVGVAFTLFDEAEDLASASVEFAASPTGPWATADISLGATTSLATSAIGIGHAVIWNSRAAPSANPSTPQGIGAGPGARWDAVYLRLRASDTVGGQTFAGVANVVGPVLVDNTFNAPPSVAVVTPAGTSGDVVLVAYTLTDPESDPCELVVELDAGEGFKPATQASGGDGVVGLSASPTGTPHVFAWDSVADGVGLSARNAGVVVRIAGRGPGLGVFGATVPFAIDNQAFNQTPSLEVVAPSSGAVASGDAVSIPLILRDAEGDPGNVELEYTDALGAWRRASIDPISPTTALGTSPSGDLHTLVWRSLTDGVAPSRAVVELRARIVQPTPARTGAWVPFSSTVDNGAVLNTPPELVFVDSAPSVVLPRQYETYFLVRDAESDPVSVGGFAFTVNGTAWLGATTDLPPTRVLTSSPAGKVHRVVWDAAADLATAQELLGATDIPMLSLRAAASDAYGAGATAVYDHDLSALESLPTSSPPLTPIDQTAGATGLAALVASGRGEVHTFWPTPFGAPPYTLRHAVSRDAGVTWAASNVVSSGDVLNSIAAVDVPGSALLVAYPVTTATTRNLRLRRSTNAGASFGAPIFITTTQNDAAMPQLFFEGGTTVHLVWRDWLSPSSRIYYARSADAGATWSAPLAVSGSETEQNPYPSVGVQGSTIFVVWVGSTAVMKYATSTNGGASFGAPVTINTDSGLSSYHALLPTPDGSLHLSTLQSGFTYLRHTAAGGWAAKRRLDPECSGPPQLFYDAGAERLLELCLANPGFGGERVHMMESLDFGATWVGPTIVARGGWSRFAKDPDSAQISAAAALQLGFPTLYPFGVALPHIGLRRRFGPVQGAGVIVGLDGAGGLRSLTRTGAELATGKKGVPWQFGGSIAVASPSPRQIVGGGTSLFAGFITDEGLFGPNPFYAVAGSTDDGLTWNVGATGTRGGALAVDDAGAAWVVTIGPTSGAPTTLQLFTAVDAGATLTGPTPLTALGAANFAPDLTWANGKLRLAFVDTSGTFDVIRYAGSANGTAWSTPANLSANTTRDAGFPRIVAGAHGRMFVVWSENAGTAWQLRYARSTDDGVTWSAPANAGTETLCVGCQAALSATVDPAGDLFVGWLSSTINGLASTAVSRDGGVTWGEPERHGPGFPSLASDVRATYASWTDASGAYVRAMRRHHVLGAAPASPLPIPDGSPTGVTSRLDVVDGGAIHDVGVWVDLAHPNAAQLTVTLTAPGGASFVLQAVGGAPRPWKGPILFRNGGISPVTSLAPLQGRQLAGLWQLTVVDATGGAAGLLRDWGLRFR